MRKYLIIATSFAVYYPLYLMFIAFPVIKLDPAAFKTMMMFSLVHLVFVLWQRKQFKNVFDGERLEKVKKALTLFVIPFIVYGVLSALILFIEDQRWESCFLVLKIGVIAGVLPFLLALMQILYTEKKDMAAGGVVALEKVALKNYKDKVVLKIPKAYIILVESKENNIIIHYEDGPEIKVFEMRQTLKAMEHQLAACEDIYKVHKSFLVNKNYVSAISGRSQAQKASLMKIDFEVPISRSFDTSLIY